ncbi:response regulator [Phormidium sp. FACHB-1136]|uniref:response regulator n=1 Tax=Phormidium sp. FACHB-1136 TaxID=2692848 RepID=UPI001689189A|nr:response regulator [Phormidium sp. FACHB-1136]MBD2426948.1 response regulator [Phormidium sp. FACHB-1136]
MKILLVSADKILRHTLHQTLSRHGFIVDLATDGEDAWDLLQAFMYDLVLLEALLPRLDGVSFCRRLRNVGNPILVLLMTEAQPSEHCVQGLDSGADACLPKPIQEPELLAHLRALSRRGLRRASTTLAWGPLTLNPTARQVLCQGQVVKVNRKEYQLLELLLSYPRQMFSCSDMGDRLWPLEDSLPTDATLKSHIRSIRRKLEQAGVQDLIQTHYGQGYCLNPRYDPGSKPAHRPDTMPDMMMDSITANIWQELMAANARLTQEIEQRKQIEAQLRRSETMLRNAQRVAQIGCWEATISTREVYWTEELYLIHGFDPSDPPPTPEQIEALIHPDDQQLHADVIQAAAQRGEAFEANLRIIRADGEVRYINARGGPLFDDDGKMVKLTGTTFDVTRWHR